VTIYLALHILFHHPSKIPHGTNKFSSLSAVIVDKELQNNLRQAHSGMIVSDKPSFLEIVAQDVTRLQQW